MNLNRLQIAGNLTRDPELKFTANGTAVCNFGVAINKRWTNEAGEKREDVTFVDATAFGKTGENISQYLKKGRGIFIEGRLKLDTWDDKTSGQKRSKLGVVVESFQFIDGKKDEQKTSLKDSPTAPSLIDNSDDVPF